MTFACLSRTPPRSEVKQATWCWVYRVIDTVLSKSPCMSLKNWRVRLTRGAWHGACRAIHVVESPWTLSQASNCLLVPIHGFQLDTVCIPPNSMIAIPMTVNHCLLIRDFWRLHHFPCLQRWLSSTHRNMSMWKWTRRTGSNVTQYKIVSQRSCGGFVWFLVVVH